MLVDLEVPEYKRDDEWWVNLIRFFVKDFNRPLLSTNLDYRGLPMSQTVEDQINWDYYYSNSDTAAMYHLIQDTNSQINKDNNIIFRLCNALEGKMSEFMEKFTVEVELLIENAHSIRDVFKNQMLFIVENKDVFDHLRSIGIEIGQLPPGIETVEDVEEYMTVTYKQFGCVAAERIAEELIKTNNYASSKVKEFLTLLVCGRVGVDRVIKNGKVVEEFVMPSELGLDLRTTNDNNFNDAARFRFRFKQYVSPSQVLQDYGDELAEIDGATEAIKSLSESSNSIYWNLFTAGNIAQPAGDYYSFYSIDSLSANRPIEFLSVIKMYVILRYDTRERINGKGKVVPIKDRDKNGDLVEANANIKGIASNYRVYEATLIGGRYVVGKKLAANAIYESFPMAFQSFPLQVCLDNYNNGIYRSRVSRMRGYQNTILKADTRISQAQDSDLGVNYLIKYLGGSSEDKDGKTPSQRVYEDFKAMHFSMVEIDVNDENGGMRQMTEVLDQTKSLNVVPMYERIKFSAIRECEAMMHLPEMAQGLQERVVGKAEQMNTIASATQGLLPLLNGFINYIQRGIQMSSNIQKIVYVADNFDEDYARRILGDREYEWLKTSVFENFEIFGIYINPYNVIDDKKRAALDAKLAFYAQGGTIDPLVDLELSQMKNYREAINYLKRYFKKRQKEAAVAAQRQEQIAASEAEKNRQAGVQKAAIPAQATVEAKKIQSAATSQDNERTNSTKKEIADLSNQVKLITKRMEEMQRD